MTLLASLAGEIESLLALEGVEGIGLPVTLLSPADLPPDLLGFVERLRGGAIELDEEMLLIILTGSRSRSRNDTVLKRLQQALLVLGRYAMEKGVPTDDILTLLDKTKRQLSRQR